LRRLASVDPRHLADFWLVSHPDLRDNARVRTLRTAVSETLRGHAVLFQGTG
jgi:hypothetical protein